MWSVKRWARNASLEHGLSCSPRAVGTIASCPNCGLAVSVRRSYASEAEFRQSMISLSVTQSLTVPGVPPRTPRPS